MMVIRFWWMLKDHKDISQHVKKILGKSEEVLRAEELARMVHSNPANFGPKKYCLRECMCEVEGQVPCPGLIPLPNEMRGKYKSQMKGTELYRCYATVREVPGSHPPSACVWIASPCVMRLPALTDIATLVSEVDAEKKTNVTSREVSRDTIWLCILSHREGCRVSGESIAVKTEQ
ncbi:UNVERIFIED_CONTAM: hypothetical protein FKN15_033900 [Acipenser sinensis]